jgi:hydrogenase-4 membrane subunit HyfE
MAMNIYDLIALSSALLAVLMLGSMQIKNNLVFYSIHTFLLSAETWWIEKLTSDTHLFYVGLTICILKAIFIPCFLNWVRIRIGVRSESAAFLTPPIAMFLGAALMGLSYLISTQLPSILGEGDTRIGATAAMSILFTGVLLMLTRKTAMSQIIGFLVIENGIYLFTLTQTNGMPMIVEMGIMLDVLVGVMICGLILFRIKKNFEHIDVSLLTGLRD